MVKQRNTFFIVHVVFCHMPENETARCGGHDCTMDKAE